MDCHNLGHPTPNGNDESCWNVKCDENDFKMLYAKSELAYNLTYDCHVGALPRSEYIDIRQFYS